MSKVWTRRNTRQFRGESSGGDGAAGVVGSSRYRDGGGTGSPRYSGVSMGILDEQVMSLLFRSHNLRLYARRLRAVAERVLWRELCISRAPQMVASLTAAAAGGLQVT
jgi:hypothetical protein